MAKYRYMTAREVAAFYRVHLNTVYRQVASGKLHPYRFGRLMRFKRSEVEALISAEAWQTDSAGAGRKEKSRKLDD